MVKIYKTARVEYTCEQMFNLVADVNHYREFVLYCSDSRVMSETDKMVRAYLEFSLGGFKQKFSTVNQLYPHEKITMKLEEGPFKYLDGLWTFEAVGDSSCNVSLHIQYEISSSIVNMILGPIFSQTAHQLVFTFTDRAKKVYG
ncbi:MAG: ubiquinone-binding protein [Legionellales bacterium]|nr:ubiquinone-binding protein [Legionellales bacterium]OUX64214.1 MAG: hypothetical protein CBE41_03945 [Gammaproteobacteria bacterium TMED281]|tara:strand:+ start:287 stop:718 length:432 start_codon:yes stop_codon:yes gene_type:complete